MQMQVDGRRTPRIDCAPDQTTVPASAHAGRNVAFTGWERNMTSRKALRTMATRGLCSLVLVAGFLCGTVAAATSSAADTVPNKVDLRVLVISDGGPNVTAIRAQLARDGVPTTVVDTTSDTRATIDDAYLSSPAEQLGKFQGIVLPGPGAVSDAEMAAIARYERTHGVREVDAYSYPQALLGLAPPAYSGVLDGSPVAVTSAAKAAGFGYLAGHLRVDDVDPAVDEVYGYLASAQSPEPPGESYTPMLEATAGGTTGSILGVHHADGRDQMVITAAFDANQQYFMEIGPGIVTWLTRGIYLGYHRNYFSTQVDDVFLADNQWSIEGDCTPGDDCYGDKSGLTTPDIRMQPADVTHLVDWQAARGMRLDMVFNGGGSDDVVADSGTESDDLLTAFQANVAAFTWINHTYSHEYLGCIQVAPPVAGEPWHCATPADYADPATVFIEPEVAQNQAQFDPATGVYYVTVDEIDSQITKNLAWADQHGIPTDPTELVTGEHSGLAILPQQPADSPNLVPAMQANDIVALAADASRESESRTVGPARTVPRHPMNVFYNVDTYLGEVSEYNWYYTSSEDGGSGICQAQPQTTTCIAPLPDATGAEAQNSFTGYIVPTGTRIALSFILANDPRPFYVHQSNLTGDRILYPLLDSILAEYGSVYDTASAPLVHLDLLGQSQQMTRMSSWTSAMDGVQAYVDASGVHVDAGTTSVAVPLTVPAGTAVDGVTLSPYGGSLSGWIAPPSGGGIVAVPTTPSGGYVGVPNPPAIGTATPGHAAATVTWTAPTDNGSPVTGYLVRAYLAANVTPAASITVGADARAATITGLLNYASYTFTVSATSAVGTSEESARSNAVVPVPSVPGAPVIGAASAGNGSATVTWTAPDDGGSSLTLYTVRLYTTGSDAPISSQDVPPTLTSATFTSLTNGVGYSFDVFAYNAAGPGPASARSATVTPQNPGPPGAPTLQSVTAGKESVNVSWAAPAYAGSSAISAYLVEVYLADGAGAGAEATPVTTRTVGRSARSATVGELTGGTAYTVDVVAVNGSGPGLPSARSAPVTPYAVPGAPTLLSVTAGNGSIAVGWAAPPDNGSAITAYRVSVFVGAATLPARRISVGGTATTADVTKLTNGVAYTVSVQAVNGAGSGPASARSDPVVPEGSTPAAPGIRTAKSGKQGGAVTATASWAAPSDTGGVTITGYIVTARAMDPSGTVIGTTVSPMLPAGTRSLEMVLPPGTYTFTVQAVNRYGTGASSAASNSVTAR
jgi:hypothetical protein